MVKVKAFLFIPVSQALTNIRRNREIKLADSANPADSKGMTAKDFDTASAALVRVGWFCSATNLPSPGPNQHVEWSGVFVRDNPGRREKDRFILDQHSVGSRAFQRAIGLVE